MVGGRVREEPAREVAARTERVRGLAFRSEPRVAAAARHEIPALLRDELAATLPPDRLAAYQEGLVTLGLWPDDADLVETVLSVSAEDVAGVYLRSRRTLYVVPDAPRPMSLELASRLVRRDLYGEMVLAHELVHALQHQHRPELFEPVSFLAAQDDVAHGIDAALEGDATFYGLAVALEGAAPPDPEELVAELDAVAPPQDDALGRAPALVRLTWVVPYVHGYRLAHREGPALLETPPVSSEQVLHADRRHEPFVTLDLGAARAALPEACSVVHENTAGELQISVLLRDLAPADPVGAETTPAARAWQGWDGDRYLALRCDGARALVWLTLWDSETDALEFAEAWRGIADAMARRAGLTAPPVALVSGREVRVVSPGLDAHGEAVAARARRARVASLPELHAFWEVDPSDPTAVPGQP